MIDPVDALILDLLEWVANRERSYAEVMDVWRTSCPRLPVWEDANDRGLIVRENVNGCAMVGITAAGLALLEQAKPPPTSQASERPTANMRSNSAFSIA